MKLKIEMDDKIIDCDIISVFKNETTNIDYVIYTDNIEDEKGEKNIYASRYIMYDNNMELLEIEKEEEWDLIEEKIRSIDGYDK